MASEYAYTTAANMATIIEDLDKVMPNEARDDYDSTKVDFHISRAERKLNDDLSSRYAVPFATATLPPLVGSLTELMAAYYILRTVFTKDNQNKNDWVEDYKKEYDAMIDKLEKRERHLTYADGDLVADSETQISSNTMNNHTVFDMDDPKDWDIDSDYLDEVKDDRASD